MKDVGDPLDLTIGSVLQIQASGLENAPRLSVRLIGYLPGASLIVTTPVVDGKVQIVRENQRYAIRVLKGERVLGFVARVLHSAVKPYPHLHIEYPDEFEQIVVRNASRVSADVPVLLRNTNDENEEKFFAAATIIDLSETGAKVAAARPLAAQGEMVHLKFQLEIGGEVEQMGLIGTVRNVSNRVESDAEGDHSVHLLGIQFSTLSRYQHILLHAWVTNRVLQSTLKGRRG